MARRNSHHVRCTSARTSPPILPRQAQQLPEDAALHTQSFNQLRLLVFTRNTVVSESDEDDQGGCKGCGEHCLNTASPAMVLPAASQKAARRPCSTAWSSSSIEGLAKSRRAARSKVLAMMDETESPRVPPTRTDVAKTASLSGDSSNRSTYLELPLVLHCGVRKAEKTYILGHKVSDQGRSN